MLERHLISRRLLITEFGRRSLAAVVLGTGLAACSSSSNGAGVTATTIRTTTTRDGGTRTTVESSSVDEAEAPDSTTAPGEALRWERVSFDFVSAYVLARGSELALVDTGVSGGIDRFDGAFSALDVGWDDVDHVVLTHLHGDHIGGLGAVLGAAPDALAYAGTADVPGIDSSRELKGLEDGDEVFGLQIIGTPGHTAGHISVFDPESGLLVAGDALNGGDNEILGPNPSFTADLEMANASARRLVELDVRAALFGHGEPVVTNAGALMADLEATLS